MNLLSESMPICSFILNQWSLIYHFVEQSGYHLAWILTHFQFQINLFPLGDWYLYSFLTMRIKNLISFSSLHRLLRRRIKFQVQSQQLSVFMAFIYVLFVFCFALVITFYIHFPISCPEFLKGITLNCCTNKSLLLAAESHPCEKQIDCEKATFGASTLVALYLELIMEATICFSSQWCLNICRMVLPIVGYRSLFYFRIQLLQGTTVFLLKCPNQSFPKLTLLPQSQPIHCFQPPGYSNFMYTNTYVHMST